MASRAHAAHQHSFGGASSRPRREVWLQRDDPIVLPRSSSSEASGVLLAAALAAFCIVGASAYAVSYAPPAALAETPLLPLNSDAGVDAQVTAAHVLAALNGPAFAVPDRAAAPISVNDENASVAPPEERPDYVIDDSAPGEQERFPQPPAIAPLEAPYPEPARPPSADPTAPPYPDPTRTPPEGVAPPHTAPQIPTPALDPENPYR